MWSFNVKTGIFITARLGSTRLERKHLLPVNGRPLLYYLIRRITSEFKEEIRDDSVHLIIASSDEPENRAFEDFSKLGASVFYGSMNNIPMRHSQAAEFHHLDAVVSIDGDDILCSPKGMRKVYEALGNHAQYVKTVHLPFGMNSSGYSYLFLSSSIKNRSHDVLETGWGRIFDDKELIEIAIPLSVRNESLRFTLDYQEDYQFFKALIEKTGERIIDMSDEEIVDVVMSDKMYRLNETISRQYWDNFKKLQQQESLRAKGIDPSEPKERR
jgi:spore coat polysaccharide biosynthesis protein SpsF (cytidylyltransferase family)